MRLLLIDDEKTWSENLQDELQDLGFEVIYEERAENAIKMIRESKPDAVLLDVMFDGVNKGRSTFREIKAKRPDLPIVILTSTMADTYEESDYPGRAFPFAKDSLKPADVETYRRFADKITSAINRTGDIDKYDFGFVVGSTERMREVCCTIINSAGSNSAILITGATGTGKELVVRAIHKLGPKPDSPFIPVNCSAITGSLIESELFGICKGGATNVAEKEGVFERADGGVIFLDEIGTMPLDQQAKLLRVLQEKIFSRVGASKTCRCANKKKHPDHTNIELNLRIIAATNIDIPAAIKEGTFRSDLNTRLKVIHIDMPSLSERKEDIEVLYKDAVQRLNNELSKNVLDTLRPDVKSMLKDYSWPGNIRQFSHAIESAMNHSQSTILLKEDFPEEIRLNQTSKEGLHCDPDKIAEMLINGEYTINDVKKKIAPPKSPALREILERTCVKYYESNKALTEDQLIKVLGLNTRANVHRELKDNGVSTGEIKRRLRRR